MTFSELIEKMQKASSDEEREASFAEADKLVAEAEAEMAKKREELRRLTAGLSAFDSKSLGDAVKCYISVEKDTSKLTDTAYKAYQSIAEILILELEC